MKTTIDLPDDLFRRTKATAVLRGESLKDFIASALGDHLDRQANESAPIPGWRSVFGRAQAAEVEPVDVRISEEFEQVDLPD